MNWSERFVALAEEERLPQLRHKVQERLRLAGVGDAVVNNTGLLLSELAHNAVSASQGGRSLMVEVEKVPDGVRLLVECETNRDLEGLQKALESSTELPSPSSERGRGLWLILTLSRGLRVEMTEQGWVRVSLIVPGPEAAE